jgi:hypothetical protein
MLNKPYVPPKVARHRSEAEYPAWTKTTVQSVRSAPSPSPHRGEVLGVETARGSAPRARHYARRSPRILASLPLEISETGSTMMAWTAVINLNGALILSSVNWPGGTELEFRNPRTEVRVRGRVVWSGDISQNGLHKLGVEFDRSSPDLWGKDYDPTIGETSELDEP